MSEKQGKSYKKLKNETRKLAKIANDRLKRLEKKGYTDTPAYLAWKKSGAERFSASYKETYNDLQSEYWRIHRFLDDRTSTIRGTNGFLKEIAKNTGIKYKKMDDLHEYSSDFFEIADGIKEYYKKNDKSSTAYLDYQKIWRQITTYVKMNKLDVTTMENKDIIENIKNNLDAINSKIDEEDEIPELKGFINI